MTLRLDDVPAHPLEKGFHTPGRTSHLFVDGCVQVWPDTDFRVLSSYSATAYCVTSFHPNASAEVARIADRPKAASSVWPTLPSEIPSADSSPAARPWAVLRPRM